MKNKFIKSVFIISIGTIITKLLGFIIKIIFTRTIGNGITIYSLIIPTISLLSSITSLSLPYAISVIVSRNKYSGKNIIFNIVPIVLLFDIFIITLLFIFSPYLANNLLKNPATLKPLLAFSLVIPFQSISGILKGYYFGKQNMLPTMISNIIEQILRLLFLIIIIPSQIKISIERAIISFILIMSICEVIQIIIYLLFLPSKIDLKNIKFNSKLINNVMNISIPITSGRIIGNICYFLEPIIITNLLLFNNYSYTYISREYAVYNSYVIPILTMPSFLFLALNQSLIPEISKNHTNKNLIKKLLRKCILITIIIGIIFCTITFFKGNLLLKLIYNTNKGINYLKILSIIFPIFFLEGIFASSLQALNESKYTMKVTLITCITKLIILVILCNASIGMYALVISEMIDILLAVLLLYKKLKLNNYI